MFREAIKSSAEIFPLFPRFDHITSVIGKVESYQCNPQPAITRIQNDKCHIVRLDFLEKHFHKYRFLIVRSDCA